MSNTFKIQLGTMEAEYRLYQTLAPLEADGFGTIHVTGPVKPSTSGYQHNTPRFVLIRTEHETWQVARYHSGLWAPELEDLDDDRVRWITEHLYKRLMWRCAE